MLQEVELLMKGLCPTLGEGEAELQKPREQQLLKETGPRSEPLRGSCRRLRELPCSWHSFSLHPQFLPKLSSRFILSSGAPSRNHSVGGKLVKKPM